jgi:hypothetical protein
MIEVSVLPKIRIQNPAYRSAIFFLLKIQVQRDYDYMVRSSLKFVIRPTGTGQPLIPLAPDFHKLCDMFLPGDKIENITGLRSWPCFIQLGKTATGATNRNESAVLYVEITGKTRSGGSDIIDVSLFITTFRTGITFRAHTSVIFLS